MLADFLGVRRRLPDISRILGVRRAFLPTAVARYRADRYAVAFGPAVRVIGAIGVEGILDRQVPDFAMVGQRVVALRAALRSGPCFLWQACKANHAASWAQGRSGLTFCCRVKLIAPIGKYLVARAGPKELRGSGNGYK